MSSEALEDPRRHETEIRDQDPEPLMSQKVAEAEAQETERECNAASSAETLVRSCSPPARKVNPDNQCGQLLDD